MCIRGGYGSNYLLEGLDLETIAAHPKPFFAYSDLTGPQLHVLDELGLPVFHGPMLAADFYLPNGVHLESFHAALAGDPYSVGAAEGLRMLKASPNHSAARGTLYGGCLSILASLLGTPWEPSTEGTLLFLEDTRRQALPDRSHALATAQSAESSKAFAASSSAKCSIALRPARRPISSTRPSSPRSTASTCPIAIGLRSGHVSRQNVTLTFGVEAELASATEATPSHLLEPAVTR